MRQDMATPTPASRSVVSLPVRGIEAIFFDMNGTLRMREPHEPTQRAAFARMLELLGKKDAPKAFWEELRVRYTAYSAWAQENLLQLSETEIWSQWLLPDVPREQIEPVAAELTLAWTRHRGRRIPKAGAHEMLLELKRRGYCLGVISNSMSTLDIPRCLEDFGWQGIFEAVVLSAQVKCRKPAPGIFWEAARQLGVDPAHCAYLGNRKSRDMIGCKRAGFALGIIIEEPGKPHPDERDQTIQPEAVIHSLTELLDIFPGRVQTETEA
jgi:putative hydrolase of the HAD superfamily